MFWNSLTIIIIIIIVVVCALRTYSECTLYTSFGNGFYYKKNRKANTHKKKENYKNGNVMNLYWLS